MRQSQKINDWKVDVRFKEKGNLHAVASGVLLVPPSDALALVTDSGAPRKQSSANRRCQSRRDGSKHAIGGCGRSDCIVSPP
jgi:hypothetical protein